MGRYGNTAIATLDHRPSRRYGSIAITPLWTPLLLSTSGLRSTRWASRAFRQNPAEPDDSHRALPSRRGHTLSTRRVLPARAEWKRVGQAQCRALRFADLSSLLVRGDIPCVCSRSLERRR